MNATIISIISVGGAFLILQCASAFTASIAIRRHRLAWIQACRSGVLSGYTRDASLMMLEREIDTEPWLAVLRRLGTIAPLLGVVLTAGSIVIGDSGKSLVMLTSTGSTPERLSESAASLAPLFAGVCVGAVLAIINQGLLSALVFVERNAIQNAIRLTADVRFLDNDDRMSRAAAQISIASDALANAVQRLEQAADRGAARANSLAAACEIAADDLKGASGSIRMSTEAIAEGLGDASKNMQLALTQCGEQVKFAAASLAEMTASSLNRLDAVVSRQSELTGQQQRLATTIEGTARAFEAAVSPLRDPALTDFQASVKRNIEGQEALIASGTKLLDIQQRAASAAGELAERFQGATRQIAGAGEILSSAGYSQLATDLERLRNSVSQFESALGNVGQGMNPVISRLTTVTDGASALSTALQGGQIRVLELGTSLAQTAAGSESLSKGFATAVTSLNEAVERAVAGLDDAARRARESEAVSARVTVPKQGWLWGSAGRQRDEQGGT
jgi:hypothetical protein